MTTEAVREKAAATRRDCQAVQVALLNNRFMVRMSEHLAERSAQAGHDLPTQVRAVYQRALGREPTPREIRALTTYAAKHGLANACRVLLNSNEFLFVN